MFALYYPHAVWCSQNNRVLSFALQISPVLKIIKPFHQANYFNFIIFLFLTNLPSSKSDCTPNKRTNGTEQTFRGTLLLLSRDFKAAERTQHSKQMGNPKAPSFA